jgi:hypothetical protein
MGMQERINKIIRETWGGHSEGMPSLKNNICTMLYKDKFHFIIEVPETGDKVYFYSPLIEKTDENNERLQQKLLEQNFFFGNLAGAALALDEQTGDVALCHVFSGKGLDVEKFEQNFENFLSEAEKKHEMLSNWLQQDEGGQLEKQDTGYIVQFLKA